MKKFLRSIALATMLLYSGLVVTEAYHGIAANHSESNCAVCQVVHSTPVLSQALQTLVHEYTMASLPFTAVVIHVAYATPILGGRSPPSLNS